MQRTQHFVAHSFCSFALSKCWVADLFLVRRICRTHACSTHHETLDLTVSISSSALRLALAVSVGTSVFAEDTFEFRLGSNLEHILRLAPESNHIPSVNSQQGRSLVETPKYQSELALQLWKPGNQPLPPIKIFALKDRTVHSIPNRASTKFDDWAMLPTNPPILLHPLQSSER